VEQLLRIVFVPVNRGTQVPPTYRDEFVQEFDDTRRIVTIKDVISPAHEPVAWTQRLVASGPPPRLFENIITFAPHIFEVAEHLVSMATNIALRCDISNADFFSDLRATYQYLNESRHLEAASQYLCKKHNDKKLWLNDDRGLENIHETAKQGASLNWLTARSILHGVPYDLPASGLYSAKRSIEEYGNLLRGCGSHVVESMNTVRRNENVENHGNNMLKRIAGMLDEPDNMCDIRIIVEGKEHHAHRLVLGAVSPFFRSLSCGGWKESTTGVLNLDPPSDSEPEEDEFAPAIVQRKTYYGTSAGVQSVIQWVYNGVLVLDDGNLQGASNDVENRLDHYLEVLELADMWDIEELRRHVENRILTRASVFIRVENVLNVRDIARRCNANLVVDYCEEYFQKNKDVVELVGEDFDN
jgi:hypothetical protein